MMHHLLHILRSIVLPLFLKPYHYEHDPGDNAVGGIDVRIGDNRTVPLHFFDQFGRRDGPVEPDKVSQAADALKINIDCDGPAGGQDCYSDVEILGGEQVISCQT
jgi:hypothetical protein